MPERLSLAVSGPILRDDSQLWDYRLAVEGTKLAAAIADLYREPYQSYRVAALSQPEEYPDHFFYGAYSRKLYIPLQSFSGSAGSASDSSAGPGSQSCSWVEKTASRIANHFPVVKVEVCATVPFEFLAPVEESEPVFLVKSASSVVRGLADIYQLRENAFNRHLGGPTPLLSMLIGGLLTAGLGYGTGKLIEHLFPESFEEDGLAQRLAVLGGLLGIAPGALAAYANTQAPDPKTHESRSFWKSLVTPFVLTQAPEDAWKRMDFVDDRWRNPKFSEGAYSESRSNRNFGAGKMEKRSSRFAVFLDSTVRHLRRIFPDYLSNEVFSHFAKEAQAVQDVIPSIPVDRFNRVVWEDPLTPVPIRAATVGLTEGASQLQGGSPIVSPLDVARLAVGMGSGSLSGLLTGRVLGALAGLTPQAQDQLQQAGIWSGILRTVIPQAYGF